MKRYTDIMGHPLKREDVATSVREMVKAKRTGPTFLQRRISGMGYGKASRIVELLEDAGVVSLMPGGGHPRTLLLKNEDAAINAALRQLKKGHR